MNGINLGVEFFDSKTGEYEFTTFPTSFPFVSEDEEYGIASLFMTMAHSPSEQSQTFFCLLSDDEVIGCFTEYEVGVIVDLVDGTSIEFSSCGEIQFEYFDTESNEQMSDTYSTFSPINFQNPDIGLTVKGMGIIASNPQAIIDSKWLKLSNTPVASLRVYGSEGVRTFKPNPNSDSFPAENVFVEHLLALNTAKNNYQ